MSFIFQVFLNDRLLLHVRIKFIKLLRRADYGKCVFIQPYLAGSLIGNTVLVDRVHSALMINPYFTKQDSLLLSDKASEVMIKRIVWDVNLFILSSLLSVNAFPT